MKAPIPATILVVAKAPIAGYAKTRLTPPMTQAEAARVAAAALLDTLDAVRRSTVARRMVALTGDLTQAECADEITEMLSEFEVVPQRGDGFGERLANAHLDASQLGFPVLQIGMDTPQVTPALLTNGARLLVISENAVLGPATDGGWWVLGLPTPEPARVLIDVPMSTSETGVLTRKALQHCGYDVQLLPTLTDVDTFTDAQNVAAQVSGRFRTAVENHRKVVAQ